MARGTRLGGPACDPRRHPNWKLVARGKLLVLGCATADLVPRRLRPDKDVHRDLNAWIAVDGAERHSMDAPLMHTAERTTAGLAEAEAPPRRGLVLGEIFFPTLPRERTGPHLRVSRAGATKGLPAPRAVAAPAGEEGRIDPVTNSTTEASAA